MQYVRRRPTILTRSFARFSWQRTVFVPQAFSEGYMVEPVVDKMSQTRFFPSKWVFPSQLSFHHYSIHTSPGICTVRSLVGAVPRYTLSPHSIKEQNETMCWLGLGIPFGDYSARRTWRIDGYGHQVTVDWALWRHAVAGQRSDLWYRTVLILNSGAITLTTYHDLPILIVAITV